MDGTLTLRGRVGSDPTSSRTKSGALSVRFRLAVTQWRRTDEGKYEDLGARWYTVRAWGRLATYVQASIHKGDPVVLVGRPIANAWANSAGEVMSDLVIHAHVLGHDLNYGTTTFFKNGGTAPALSTDTHSQGASAVSVNAHSTPSDSEFHTPLSVSDPNAAAQAGTDGGVEPSSLTGSEDTGVFHSVYSTATSNDGSARERVALSGDDGGAGGNTLSGDDAVTEDEPLALSA